MTDSTSHQVRAWLGEHLVIDYVGPRGAAARFEDAIGRSFTSLRVTNEPLMDDVVTAGGRPRHPQADDR
ncbi:hypothetical protein BJY22_007020 [Kribbella shirazensis]|uniref:Uncharacterized protein n=1 Tax=Kribbella shirazensis TaxID=1105143 RepID=A0A7X5VHH7_9ACTN|nr:hypothetical protein [Kribbella shirazensis]